MYYKNRPLVLPKSGNRRAADINTFEAASIIDNRSNAFETAIVTFEGYFTDTAGVAYRQLVTLHIRPMFNDNLQVYNPCNGATVVIAP